MIVGRGCLSCFFFATGEVAGPLLGFLCARRSRLRRRQCKASSRRSSSFLYPAQRSVSLCRRCLHRGHSRSLFARSGRRMCFPFAVAVALSTLSLRTFRSKGDLVVSLPHVALFFPLARTRSWCPGVFQLTVARGTERCVRSKASHSMAI